MRTSQTDRRDVQVLSANLREALSSLYDEGRPPSDPRAALLLRRVRRGENKAVDAVATLYAAAIRDRRPAAKLTALARALAAYVESETAPAAEKPIAVLHAIETRAGAACDVAQFRETREQTPEAKRDCLAHVREHLAALTALERALARECFSLTSTTAA
jgi:hypothetical protein